MQEKRIILKHHMDDYECMWNGIEDLYIQQTGQVLPPSFFFVLSGFGSFCYMKTPQADLKRMIALGDGRTKQMYEFLAPIVGFEYKHSAYGSFEQALRKAKAEIDAGHPSVLGALDMYYLPYFSKLYHEEHIPFHYVLMVGYDDVTGCVFLHDCGREGIQTLSYDDLRSAWNCSYPGLSKPNTVCTIRMSAEKNKYQIAKEAFAKRGEQFLNPPVGFVGRKGFEKLISDLPRLKEELAKDDYDKLFSNLVTFFGTVPTLPNKLRGIQEPDAVDFFGGFDKMSRVLSDLGCEFRDEAMLKASARFREGTGIISEITNVIVNYLVIESDRMNELPKLFTKIMDVMTDGFVILRGSSF